MGLVSAKLTLSNPRLEDLRPLEVTALADSGSNFLCLPLHIAQELRLETLMDKEITTADGKRAVCPYVGPVRVTFENRGCYVGAVILGNQVLLGAIPMEDMDLVILLLEQRVAPNPLRPQFAGTSI